MADVMTIEEAKDILNAEEYQYVSYAKLKEARDVLKNTNDVAYSANISKVDAFLNGEISRLTDTKTKDEDKFFTYEQLNQMSDIIDHAIISDDYQQKARQALDNVIYLRLKEIVESKSMDLDPMAYADIMELAKKSDVKGVKEAIQKAAHRYDQENGLTDGVTKNMIDANVNSYEELMNEIDLEKEPALEVSRVIGSNLRITDDEGRPVDYKGNLIDENEQIDISADFVGTSAQAARDELIKSVDFMMASKQEKRQMLIAEINLQSQINAYTTLLQDKIAAKITRDDVNITREDITNKDKLAEKVSPQTIAEVQATLEKISKGAMFANRVDVKLTSVMSVLANVSSRSDSFVARLGQKIGDKVPAIQKLKAWNTKHNEEMSQKYGKKWDIAMKVCAAAKKSAPSLAMSGLVLMTAGSTAAVTVPVAAAYGTFRLVRGMKPLIKKFSEARAENPDASFIDVVKANKAITARAVIGVFAGTAGIALAGAATMADVASEKAGVRMVTSAAMAGVSLGTLKNPIKAVFGKNKTWQERAVGAVTIGGTAWALFASYTGIKSTWETHNINNTIEDLAGNNIKDFDTERTLKALLPEGQEMPKGAEAQQELLKKLMKAQHIDSADELTNTVVDNELTATLKAVSDENISKVFGRMSKWKELGLTEEQNKNLANMDAEQQRAVLHSLMKAKGMDSVDQVDTFAYNLETQNYVNNLDQKALDQYIADWAKIAENADVKDKASFLEVLRKGGFNNIEEMDKKIWEKKLGPIVNAHTGTGDKFYPIKLGLTDDNKNGFADEYKRYMLEKNIFTTEGLDKAVWDISVKDISAEDVAGHLAKLGMKPEEISALTDDATKLTKLHDLAVAKGCLDLGEVKLMEEIPGIKASYIDGYIEDNVDGSYDTPEAKHKAFLEVMRSNGETDVAALVQKIHDGHVGVAIDADKIQNLDLGIDGVENAKVTESLSELDQTNLKNLKFYMNEQGISADKQDEVIKALQEKGIITITPAPEDVPVHIDATKVEGITVDGVESDKIKAAMDSLKDNPNPTQEDVNLALKAQGIEGEDQTTVTAALEEKKVVTASSAPAEEAKAETKTETETKDPKAETETKTEQAVAGQDGVPAYNKDMGISERQYKTLLSTRSKEDIVKMYNNLSDEVMKKNFPGMSQEEVMYKYNRLDAWTARVKKVTEMVDGKSVTKLVPLLDKDGNPVPRYQMQQEMESLKKIIECGESVDENHLKAAQGALGHIKTDGDTDLSGTRTCNRITSFSNEDCAKNNKAYGEAGNCDEVKEKVVKKEDVVNKEEPVVEETPSVEETPVVEENPVVVEELPLTPLPSEQYLFLKGTYGNEIIKEGSYDADGQPIAGTGDMWLIRDDTNPNKLNVFRSYQGEVVQASGENVNAKDVGYVAGLNGDGDKVKAVVMEYNEAHNADGVEVKKVVYETSVRKSKLPEGMVESFGNSGLIDAKGTIPNPANNVVRNMIGIKKGKSH